MWTLHFYNHAFYSLLLSKINFPERAGFLAELTLWLLANQRSNWLGSEL